MIQEGINTFLDTISTRFVSLFDFIADPLWRWYVAYGVLVIVCVFIGYFLIFKWVRAGLGFILLIAGAFVLGGRTMHNELKPHIDAARVRAKEKPEPETGHDTTGWKW